MTRRLDRLNSHNFKGPPFRRLWNKNCELVEEALDSVFEALASMDDIAPITIYADYDGTVQAGQLPRNVQARRYNGSTDVTTSSAWSYVVISGGITCTIGAATGILNITALTSTAVVEITSTYLGIVRSRLLTVNKSTAPPPSGGSGGGTSASDSSFSSFNAITMATVSDTLTVTAGSAGIVTLSAPLLVGAGTEAAGTFEAYGIWQWDNGGVWTDLGTEVASNPDASADGSETYNGSISVAYSHTGRTPGNSYSYRLRGRKSAAYGGITMYFFGTASAVGS